MALRALRAAAMAFLPSLALAQTGTVTVDPTQVNRADCAGTSSVSIKWTNTAVVTDKFRLVAASGCTSAPVANGPGTLGPDVSATGSSPQTESVSVSSINAAVTPNCTGVDDTPTKICVFLVPGGTGSPVLAGSGDFLFQTAVPPAPNASVSPANGAIEVSFSAGMKDTNYKGDSLQYEVQYKPAGGTYTSNGRSSTSPVRIEGLTNGTTYTVRVYAWSAVNPPLVGNQSLPSPEASATPDNFLDYWSRYKQLGGREEGGCGAGGAGALAPLLLALAVFLRRRA